MYLDKTDRLLADMVCLSAVKQDVCMPVPFQSPIQAPYSKLYQPKQETSEIGQCDYTCYMFVKDV